MAGDSGQFTDDDEETIRWFQVPVLSAGVMQMQSAC